MELKRRDYEEMIRKALIHSKYDIMELHHLQSMANNAQALIDFNMGRDTDLDSYCKAVLKINDEVQEQYMV